MNDCTSLRLGFSAVTWDIGGSHAEYLTWFWELRNQLKLYLELLLIVFFMANLLTFPVRSYQKILHQLNNSFWGGGQGENIRKMELNV